MEALGEWQGLTPRECRLLESVGPAWLRYTVLNWRIADRMEGLLRRQRYEYVYFHSYESKRLIYVRCTPLELARLDSVARAAVRARRPVMIVCRQMEAVIVR